VQATCQPTVLRIDLRTRTVMPFWSSVALGAEIASWSRVDGRETAGVRFAPDAPHPGSTSPPISAALRPTSTDAPA
jgi:hypothetical protein